MKKAGRKKSAPGREWLVDHKISGMRDGEDLLSPINHSHNSAASGGLWTALAGLTLNNSCYMTTGDFISDPTV